MTDPAEKLTDIDKSLRGLRRGKIVALCLFVAGAGLIVAASPALDTNTRELLGYMFGVMAIGSAVTISIIHYSTTEPRLTVFKRGEEKQLGAVKRDGFQEWRQRAKLANLTIKVAQLPSWHAGRFVSYHLFGWRSVLSVIVPQYELWEETLQVVASPTRDITARVVLTLGHDADLETTLSALEETNLLAVKPISRRTAELILAPWAQARLTRRLNSYIEKYVVGTSEQDGTTPHTLLGGTIISEQRLLGFEDTLAAAATDIFADITELPPRVLHHFDFHAEVEVNRLQSVGAGRIEQQMRGGFANNRPAERTEQNAET